MTTTIDPNGRLVDSNGAVVELRSGFHKFEATVELSSRQKPRKNGQGSEPSALKRALDTTVDYLPHRTKDFEPSDSGQMGLRDAEIDMQSFDIPTEMAGMVMRFWDWLNFQSLVMEDQQNLVSHSVDLDGPRPLSVDSFFNDVGIYFRITPDSDGDRYTCRSFDRQHLSGHAGDTVCKIRDEATSSTPSTWFLVPHKLRA